MHFIRGFLCFGLIFILFVNVNAGWFDDWWCPDSNNKFRCRSYSMCIDAALKCDRKFDCADHSDEENCENFGEEQSIHYIATTTTSSTQDPAKVVFLTINNCLAVKFHFFSSQICPEYKCKGEEVCYSSEDICNGYYECILGADEIGCPRKLNHQLIKIIAAHGHQFEFF